MATAPSASARAAAKRSTRQALVRAARELFAAQGLDGPSLDAICARAGFTRGAFYVHFRSRDELVLAVMEETLRELVDGVVAAGEDGGGVAGTVKRYAAVAGFLRAHPPGQGGRGARFHQVLEAARRVPRIGELLRGVSAEARSRLERAARAGQQEGSLSARAAPRELATLLFLVALGVFAAEELELPLDLPATRDGLLALLAPA